MGDTDHVEEQDEQLDGSSSDSNETADDSKTAQSNEEADDHSGDSNADDNSDDDGDPDNNDADEVDVDDGAVPELRKPSKGASNAEWAAWRAQQKAQKAQQQAEEGQKSDDQKSEEADDQSDEEYKKPSAEERLAALEQAESDREVELSVKDFVIKNPDFSPYAKKAERFAKDASRRNIPIKSIFYEVAGDDLIKIGAARQKQADIKARQSQTGGGSSGGDTSGSKSYKDMDLDEFEKEVEAIKLGKKS